MLVNCEFSGMLMVVRLLQSEKAHTPMLVTPSGMVMEVRLLQLWKAEPPMLVTLSGIIVAEHPVIRVLLLVSMIALHPPRESYTAFPSATVMAVRLVQPEKASSPMLVTPSGMVMAVRLLQP
jgi:hypothetical protein